MFIHVNYVFMLKVLIWIKTTAFYVNLKDDKVGDSFNSHELFYFINSCLATTNKRLMNKKYFLYGWSK